MTGPRTIADLQRLLEELDREMDKLRGLLRQCAAVREQVATEIAVLRSPAGNDP